MQIRYGFILIFTLFISGCNTLVKPNKLYSSQIYNRDYNEDKHKFQGFGTNYGAIFAVGYDKSVGFVRENGQEWHWIGKTGWITKENYSEKMQPFIKFLAWSKLPKSEQESMRIKYNGEAILKEAAVEFRYFKDGSPAFVDLAYANTWSLDNALLDRLSNYYPTQSINQMVMMINAELAIP
ncbi:MULTISPECIES: hypothetical protein [Dickeya]|uniref:hypothetical protein n=1 Tax=Dickeya TaxID=204037 RepID=UPI00316703E7